MKSFSKRVASFTMAAAMVLSLAVPTDAEAASKYSLTKKTSITSSTTGKYYIKGVSKKQYVKVSVSGKAKSGVTVKTSAGKKLTSSTKLNGTGKTLTLKVTNKGVVGKSYKLTAKVYNSNNKVAKTLTSTTYVKNNNFTLNTTAVSVVEDETATVKATAKYDYTTAGYTWTSADSNIATVSNGVITGVNAGTTSVTVKRGNYTKTVAVVVTEGPVKVTSATAKNATTVELVGKHLDKLTVKDITVAGYTVETIKAAEDAKTATVTLGSALIPNKEETLEVKIGEEKASFVVKYSTEAAEVAVQEGTFATTSTASLTVLVNGVATSLDELKANGYSTMFYAFDDSVNGALVQNANSATLFGITNSASATGKLSGAIIPNVYKVKVVLTKGGTTKMSGFANITITDKAIHEQKIARIDLTGKQIGITDKYAYRITGDSLQLKVGDLYEITKLETETTFGVNAAIPTADLNKVLVKSSDTSVATIKATVAGAQIVAHKSGTTTLTVTYGSLTKTINLTVKTDGRSFDKVEIPAGATKEVIIENNVSFDVFAVDNYGAYMIGQPIYVELPQNDTATTGFTLAGGAPHNTNEPNSKCAETDTDGKVTVSYTASSVASAKATFSIYKGNTTAPCYEGVLRATHNVTNIAMDKVSYKLEVVKQVNYSADTEIDFNPLKADNKIKINLNRFYNNIYKNTEDDWGDVGSKIYYDDSKITVYDNGTKVNNGASVTGIAHIEVAPKGAAGNTDIVVKDATQNTVASITITNKNTVPGVTDVKLAFNSINYDVNTTIDYKNVLSVVPNKVNPEVPNVTLSNNVNNYSVVKLCTADNSVDGYYYNATTNNWESTTQVAPAPAPLYGKLPKGTLYVEAPEGNLAIGLLAFNKTIGGDNKYTLVTDGLLINANQATSINFAMIDIVNANPDPGVGNLTKVMNVLASSISVNSYK